MLFVDPPLRLVRSVIPHTALAHLRMLFEQDLL
jgi:hypothetical protein